MVQLDEEALICDLAETYQIYDYKQLPLSLVTVFACGLREDARIKMKLSNQLVSLNITLLADICDKLCLLLWSKTKDAQKGINRPTFISDRLSTTKSTNNKSNNQISFTSGEDFERVRKNLLGGA